MAGFVFNTAKILVRGSATATKVTGKAVVRSVPAAFRPAKEFAYAAATGTARRIPLGASGSYSQTHYISTTAGIQARQLAKWGARTTFVKSPYLAFRATKAVVRATIRDEIITPYYATARYGWSVIREGRRWTGKSSYIERAGDAFFVRSSRALDRFGLAPGFFADSISVGRIYLFGGAYEGIKALSERRQLVDEYVSYIQDHYRDMRVRSTEFVGQLTAPLVPAPAPVDATPPVVVPAAPVVVPPAPSAPIVPPAGPYTAPQPTWRKKY